MLVATVQTAALTNVEILAVGSGALVSYILYELYKMSADRRNRETLITSLLRLTANSVLWSTN